MDKPKETVLPAIGEYFKQVRKLSQDSFSRVEPPIKAKLEPFKMPKPSEPTGVKGEQRESVERPKAKRESVKPLSPTRRDAKGNLITYKPREQTLLKVKMPRTFENELGIEKPALFSEMIEPDYRPESVAESIKRESLPIVKALVKRIRNGEIVEDEHLTDSAEFIALQAIAKRANVCLKCHKALKWTDREYYNANGEHATQYIAKCRPFYCFARINGKAQYRLWCGYSNGESVLVKRKPQLNSRGHAIGISTTVWKGKPFGVPEMVNIDKKCKC